MRIAPSFILIALLSGLMLVHGARADAAFQAWLQSLWPQAQALGVSRATFDLATNGLDPDLSLPDRALPRHVERDPRAGDAGLSRQAQGEVSRGVSAGVENSRSGADQARRHAQL